MIWLWTNNEEDEAKEDIWVGIVFFIYIYIQSINDQHGQQVDNNGCLET